MQRFIAFLIDTFVALYEGMRGKRKQLVGKTRRRRRPRPRTDTTEINVSISIDGKSDGVVAKPIDDDNDPPPPFPPPPPKASA